MILNKSLLLKCLGGVAACSGVAGIGILGSQSGLGGTSSSEKDVTTSELTITDLIELIAKVGLTTCTSTESPNNECIIGSPFNVQQGTTKEEGKSKQDSSPGTPGKIKVYSDETYNNKFKFVIEDGDITLTGNGSSISKLEQFETYEIKKEGTDSSEKWYFSRKTETKDEIKKALGLPSGCNLDNGCTDVEVTTNDIASINFEGKTQSQTPTISGTITLKVTKENTNTSDYPLGYKFELKSKNSSVILTLGNNKTVTLQQSTATEFRIKKSTGNNIALEEAWTKERLLGKVGLECNGSSNECTQKSGENINIKFEDNNKLENKTLDTSNGGKIKLYTGDGTTGYNKGFKFVIEEKDISITGETNKKLEQFETYEIKKEDSSNNWYLTRKDKAGKGIKTALGLPDGCDLVNDNGCTDVVVDSTNIGQIKFDGLASNQSATIAESTKLTVSKVDTTDTDFPFGYKFTFKAQTTDATVTINTTKSITIKTSTGTEFKIKKPATGNSITLEEAWTKERLLGKVGLQCDESSNECTQKSGQTTNIKQETSLGDKTIPASASSSGSGKIKLYTTDANGYNQGFKFVIEGGDITVDSGSSKKLEQFETYEIKKEDNKWYFSRKEKAADEIKRLLGLPTSNSDCSLPTSENPTTCSNISSDDLKNINFKDKESTGASINSSGTANLTITKTTTETEKYPLGYKFAFDPKEEVTISTNPSNKIAKGSKTEFKIEVTKSSGTTPVKLSLEKAWTAKTLGEKVGLVCPDPSGESSDKKCSFTNDSINVNNDGTKITNGKLGDGSSDKKMTYQEDQEGYNQGLKFYLDENDDITLTNGSESGDATGEKKIHKKGDNGGSETTYEIKEESGTWYLTKHTPAAS